MGTEKYKYYFKKPRSAISKDIFGWLLTAGLIYVASGSPNFVKGLTDGNKRFKKYPRKKFYDHFYRMRQRGLINVEYKGKQIYISLTPKGRKNAGYLQIDSLKINKPTKWDNKWRLVIFDIAQLMKTHREAFRGKLKELGFLPLQRSVWIHPFDCRAEVDLLKDFFGLTDKEIRLIVAEDIGESDKFKKLFKL